MERKSNLTVILETGQISSDTEKVLLDVFRSKKKRSSQKWLKRYLEREGVKPEYAHLLAFFEGANRKLFEFNPLGINLFINSLIEEFKEAGFDRKIALQNPGRLREFQRLGLPVTSTTICRSSRVLLKNKQELQKLGLPVTSTTICRKPQTLLENKQELQRLGLRVTIAAICLNPQILLKKQARIAKIRAASNC